MPGQSSKTTSVSTRFPNKTLAQVDAWAAVHDINRSQAVVELVEKALSEPDADLITKADFDILAQKIETLISKQDTLISKQETSVALLGAKIEAQPIVVQGQLEAPADETPDEPTYTQLELNQAVTDAVYDQHARYRNAGFFARLLGKW